MQNFRKIAKLRCREINVSRKFHVIRYAQNYAGIMYLTLPELVPDSCHSFRDLSSVTLVFVPFWNWKRYPPAISDLEFFSRIVQERKVTFFAVTKLIRVLLLDDLKPMH